MTDDWRFSISGEAWRRTIDAAPTEETKRAFWAEAVPRLAVTDRPLPPRPCVVVSRVNGLSRRGNPPAGPLGRAKGLLDALHDDRKTGPWYRDMGGRGPLIDDHPLHVRGLAVEVRAGEPRTDSLLGSNLQVAGELLASAPVSEQAPNDIAGTAGEKSKIAMGRAAFAAAVKRSLAPLKGLTDKTPAALVIRHRPQRDEDNTWATWIAAVCGARDQRETHWAYGAPLAGWAPTAIASVADRELESPVVIELWA